MRPVDETLSVLVVDDDPLVLQVIVVFLESVHWEVQSAPGGAAAIELLEEREFDVLLTDLRMPGVDGFEVIRAARRLHPHMRIVSMSGYHAEGGLERALGQGANAHLDKPFGTLASVLQALRG